MKTKHIFWGILFISFGLLWLLDRMLYLNVEWDFVWKLWPVVIILWGISLIIGNNIIKAIITGLTAFILALAIFTSIKFGIIHTGNGIEWTIDDKNSTDRYGISDYSESYESNYKKASLHFDAGAGTFISHDTTTDLFFASTEGRKDNYTLTKSGEGDNIDLNFNMGKGKVNFFHFKKLRNRVDFRLNSLPVWDLDFNLGAASIDFDLSPYKTEKIAIDMGAASLKLKLGDRADETRLTIDAGASSIDINVPEGAACEIKTDASLSSKHINGFNKINDDLFRTDNFETAKKKIYISIESGVSSIKVNRYSIPSV